MKKWMYIVFPGAMLGVFLFFYFSDAKQAAINEKQRAVVVSKQKAEEAERKRVIEEKARLDAERRTSERLTEEKKKEADKLAKSAAELKRVVDDTDKANADVARYTKEVSTLESQLELLLKSKDKASREAFDVVKQVEKAKVDRRNAEIEIQRLTEMVVRRAAESSLVKPTLTVAPSRS